MHNINKVSAKTDTIQISLQLMLILKGPKIVGTLDTILRFDLLTYTI